MIVISEYKLTNTEIKRYKDKGYRFAYGYEEPVIHKGEAVGILLNTMYKSTIDLIENLLYKHHNVTLKYSDKSYTLNTLEEWRYTHQSDKDQIKVTTKYHPIYKIYLDKRAEFFEQQKAKGLNTRYQLIIDYLGSNPDDTELDNFINTFGYLYDIDTNFPDRVSKLYSYAQLKYYLEIEMPYANEPRGINPEDESIFAGIQFMKPEYEEPIIVESFGDIEYLEDTIYKHQISC